MSKQLMVIAVLIIVPFVITSCGRDEAETLPINTHAVQTGDEADSPGLAAPMVYVNDRIYILNSNVRDGRTILNDSFNFIGEVQSLNAHHRGVLIEPENFQSNGHVPVGSRLYQAGDDIVAVFPEGLEGVIDGYHLPMRYIGVED